jgi:hypothetical protein
MNDDHDDRRQLARQVAHAEALLRDTRERQLPALVARRRVVLRGMRKRLRALGGKAGETR